MFIYAQNHGKQMVVDIWVPLDFCLFFSMGIYAYICLRRIKDQAELKKIFDKSPLKINRMDTVDLFKVSKRIKKRKMKVIKDHLTELQRLRTLATHMENVRHTVNLSEDVYSKSFRAFHKITAAKQQLTLQEIHEGWYLAIYVFFLQMFFVLTVFMVCMGIEGIKF